MMGALLEEGLKPATLKQCKSSQVVAPVRAKKKTWPLREPKGATFTSRSTAALLRSLPSSPDPNFNELSLSLGGSSQRTRVRVRIPHSVQTHKTLTGSLCGAPQEARRASGGIWPESSIIGSKSSAWCFRVWYKSLEVSKNKWVCVCW